MLYLKAAMWTHCYCGLQQTCTALQMVSVLILWNDAAIFVDGASGNYFHETVWCSNLFSVMIWSHGHDRNNFQYNRAESSPVWRESTQIGLFLWECVVDLWELFSVWASVLRRETTSHESQPGNSWQERRRVFSSFQRKVKERSSFNSSLSRTVFTLNV